MGELDRWGDGPTPSALAISVKGWSTQGELITRNPNKSVSLQANFASKPETYTVQFDLVLPVGQTLPVNCIALVEWAVEGNTVTRKMTVSKGATISGVGQAVRVVVKDISPLNDDGDDEFLPYKVTINIAPGVRPSDGHAPSLFLIGDVVSTASGYLVNPGASVVIPIPDGAGASSVRCFGYRTDNAPCPDGSVLLSQGDASTDYCINDFRTQQPLNGNATEVTVNNTGNSSFVAFVSLGIDG